MALRVCFLEHLVWTEMHLSEFSAGQCLGTESGAIDGSSLLSPVQCESPRLEAGSGAVL